MNYWNKTKKISRPWITQRQLKKLSKKKQRLYEKFLWSRNYRNEKAYKLYRNLFEKLKFQSKKLYFQSKLKQYNNFKSILKIMKVIIGNSKAYNDKFPKSLDIDKRNIFGKKTIAEKFNSYYINVECNLATKIPSSNTSFKSYLPK